MKACLGLARASRDVAQAYASLIKDVVLSPDDRTLIEAAGRELRRGVSAPLVADELCARGLAKALQFLYHPYEAPRAEAQGDSVGSFAYGEISPKAFLVAFRSAKRHLTGPIRFYDLGSGRGHTVFMAALVDEAVSACGVEILESHHDCATLASRKYRPRSQGRGTVEFVQADVATWHQWADADLVFVNWICFDRPLMEAVSKVAHDELRPGAVLVTFTTAIQSTRFVVVDKIRVPDLPWGGPCTIFVHVALTPEDHGRRLATGEPTPFDADQAIALPRPGESCDLSDAMGSMLVGAVSEEDASPGRAAHLTDLDLILDGGDDKPRHGDEHPADDSTS